MVFSLVFFFFSLFFPFLPSQFRFLILLKDLKVKGSHFRRAKIIPSSHPFLKTLFFHELSGRRFGGREENLGLKNIKASSFAEYFSRSLNKNENKIFRVFCIGW